MNFLDTITPPAARERLKELRSERPDVNVALILAGPEKEAKWIQTVGPGCDDTLRRLLPPIPPRELRSITNAPDEPIFLWQGTTDASFLVDLYERHAVNRPARPVVLDFGCGCGRVTRLLGQSRTYKTIGSEANPDHVAWCRAQLADATTLQNGAEPPFALEDGSVDFAFAISVFSHFPQDRAMAWLHELARVLSDKGLLIFTTHGYRALSTLATSAQHRALFNFSTEDIPGLIRRVSEERFVFLPYNATVISLANVGENYGSTFIDPNWMMQAASGLFELREFMPGGFSESWQDAFVFQKADRRSAA